MANLSEADKQYLNPDQQREIAALKDKWAAATTDAERAAANKAAEAIRAQAGYSGGSDGSAGVLLNNQPQQVGGQSAADVAKWVQDYRDANMGYNTYYGRDHWNNGYSVGMNLRSQANYIRQQMDANSKAWHTADAAQKEYLHQQNVELEKILRDAVGGASSTYNDKTGQWETANANLGYGVNTGQYNDRDWYKNVYGMTDEQIDKYRNDTDRYYNFVDQRVVRNWQDESNGFTGEYAQFVNGPYAHLLGNYGFVPRSTYVDVIGDGFNERDYSPNNQPETFLKYNNGLTDYTRDLAAYTENGVIMPNILNGSRSPGAENGSYRGVEGSGPSYADSVDDWPAAWRSDENDMSLGGMGWIQKASGGYGGASGVGGSGGLDGYLNSLYDANLQSQLAQLQMAYNNNLAQLDKTKTETNAEYDEQKRQTQGDSERAAANWRELAIAQGLNTGAIGQAALSQNNQLQSNLNTLGAAQAQNLANIEQQRALLGQQFQLQILQAQADNDFERAQALYNEAVRQDEILREQQAQQQAFMQELLMKSMSGGGSSGGSRSSGGGGLGSSTDPSAALGSNAWWRDMMSGAAKAGQSVSDYINDNYKALGIPYTQLSKYSNGFNDWVNKNTSEGMTSDGYAILDAIHNNPSMSYTDALELVNKSNLNNYELNKIMDELAGYTPG